MGMKKKRQIDVSRGKLGMDASPKAINENKLRLSTTESASNFMPRLECLVGQIHVQKPKLVVATIRYLITLKYSIINIDSNI